MTHVFSFYDTISQCWDVFYSEYRRLAEVLGHPPFEFETPKHSIINEYVPKNGDEIMVNFWDGDRKQILLVVEAEIVPDEDRQYNIFVHPQGNSFQEPCKSAMSIWKEIKSALERAGGQADSTAHPKPKKKRGMQLGTEYGLKQLREIRLEAIKNGTPIPKKEAAMGRANITDKTWRKHDPELWARWDDKGYR